MIFGHLLLKRFFTTKKWPTPASFHLLSSLQTHIANFTTNTYVKNVHPVHSAVIRTHDLWNMILPPITTRPGAPAKALYVYVILHLGIVVGM